MKIFLSYDVILPNKPLGLMTNVIATGANIRKSENFNQTALTKTIKKINKLNPDYIIHLGDITEEGTKEDYDLAKKLLSKIKKPVIYIIGNHDARNVGYKLYPDFFAKDLNRGYYTG